MELKFLGRGGAFNIFESNTSAYFIEDNNLFIIDVGETVFESLMKKNILDKVDNIYILITHTHSDHVGSLGSLILYTFYNKKYCANIVLPTNPKYLNEIISLLKIFGCKEDKYNFIYENNLDNKFLSFNNVRFKETTHSKDMNCYGILFDTNNGYIYYSGDTNELSNVEILIKENKLIDKIFIDLTNFMFFPYQARNSPVITES